MKEREEYMNRYGCEPSCDTLAAVLQVPTGQLYRAIECTYEPVSLSEPVYGEEGEDLHLGDRISDCESETDWLCTMLLKSAVQNLPTREKQILQLRFMVGHTQTEVAKEIGISQAQVSRLEKGALQQIRREIAL
jgi:RNA polymerase sporulation-specific sigma factor